MPITISTEQLLTELRRVTDLLGHAPSYEEMKAQGCYGCATYQRRFGSWDEVKKQVGWIPPWESFNPHNVTVAEGGWLAGFIDGEGCFRIQKPSPGSGGGLSRSYAPVFALTIRDDDAPAMEELKRIIGIPDAAVHIDNRAACIRKGMTGANPALKINIRDLPTLAFQLIPLLKLYPLRSKKKYELVVFTFAVNLFLKKRQSGRRCKRYTDEERGLLEKCYWALRELKQYQANPQAVVDKYDLPIKF